MHKIGSDNSNIYKPYFPQGHKKLWERDNPALKNKDRSGETFDGTTDNDYLSVIEAKRHRYNKDKQLLQDLGAKVKKVLLNPSINPDEEITQQDLATLLQKGVLDQN